MKWLLLFCAAILQSQRPLDQLFHHPTLQFHSNTIPQQPVGLSTFVFSGFQIHCVTEWAAQRWRDNISVAGVLFKAPRVIFLCGLKKSLQPKVNGANSICHGLHGGKIKNFFLFKAQGFFLPCISKKERRQLTFVALCRVYFGFLWNGTKLLEMSPIKRKAQVLTKLKTWTNPIWTHPALIRRLQTLGKCAFHLIKTAKLIKSLPCDNLTDNDVSRRVAAMIRGFILWNEGDMAFLWLPTTTVQIYWQQVACRCRCVWAESQSTCSQRFHPPHSNTSSCWFWRNEVMGNALNQW